MPPTSRHSAVGSAPDHVAGREPAAPGPAAATRPTRSRPTTNGNTIGTGYAPERMSASTGLTVVHQTSTSTSVGPGRGDGTMPYLISRAEPVRSMNAARILVKSGLPGAIAHPDRRSGDPRRGCCCGSCPCEQYEIHDHTRMRHRRPEPAGPTLRARRGVFGRVKADASPFTHDSRLQKATLGRSPSRVRRSTASHPTGQVRAVAGDHHRSGATPSSPARSGCWR